jgi:CRP-like cAMP-binding protein
LLAAFGPDLDVVRPQLRTVRLTSGQVLSQPGDRVGHVYFLHGGIVSKLAVFEDGTEIECALVGREGAVGAMSALGIKTALTRDVCHMVTQADVIEVGALMAAARSSQRIHAVLDQYCAWKMSCAVRNGACNACHPVEQRLCRWLLTCCDVIEAREIRLPQDIFAKMLGVQRTSVNPILQRLRALGLVDLGRSRLLVLDSRGLQARSCECYGAMKKLEHEIWGLSSHDGGFAHRADSAA